MTAGGRGRSTETGIPHHLDPGFLGSARMRQRNHDHSASVTRSEVTHGVGRQLPWIGAVDDRRDFAGVDEPRETLPSQ